MMGKSFIVIRSASAFPDLFQDVRSILVPSTMQLLHELTSAAGSSLREVYNSKYCSMLPYLYKYM